MARMGNFFTAADAEINGQFISIDKANLLLRERGEIVYGSSGDGEPVTLYRNMDGCGVQEHERTHAALLINITPIEKEDTAEGLLRELMDAPELMTPVNGEAALKVHEVLNRARKLLERSGE